MKGKGPIPISDWAGDMKKDFWKFIVNIIKSDSNLNNEKIYDILIVGSVARGDCKIGSDIDTIVLMDRPIVDLIKKYTNNYKLLYKDFLCFQINQNISNFRYWNGIPIQIYIADKLFDNNYNGYNIKIYSLLKNSFVNSNINVDDDLFLQNYKKNKESTMGLNYEEDLKEIDGLVIGDIKYDENRYKNKILNLYKLIVKVFNNVNTGIYNSSTLCCFDLIPTDGNLKIVNFNTNCLLTEEIIDKFDFTNFLEADVKNFKVMNLSVGSHRHDSVISDKIINKFSDKFNCPIKVDVQEGWPNPFKIKEDRENFYIKLTYDNNGLIDMFATKYIVFRDLMTVNGLDNFLPKQDNEITIVGSKFPNFVSKGLYFPGMSSHGFFNNKSKLYQVNKKADSNKYFEEFIIPDIYLDRNVMIRLYFIIGKVGTFLLGKNHFYHTIHPLKNEDGRYVWVYRD